MYKILDPTQVSELLLIRHGWISPEYELTDNVNSYGKLAYNGISRRIATAESATDKWVFTFGQLFSRTITITDETGTLIGEAKREIFSRVTLLTLQTGFTAQFYRPSFFSRIRIWQSNEYGIIMRIKSYPFIYKDEISILQTTVSSATIPLLVFLGVHLTILRRRKRSAR